MVLEEAFLMIKTHQTEDWRELQTKRPSDKTLNNKVKAFRKKSILHFN